MRREALDIVSHSPHTEHKYIHVFHMSSNQSKLEINLSIIIWLCVLKSSPRFLCRLTAFFSTCWSRGTSESSTYGKQRICRCNFASTHFHVSWLSDFIFYPKPLYKSLRQSFFYSFITILPSESGVALDNSTIFP